jgi:hypothetical protein
MAATVDVGIAQVRRAWQVGEPLHTLLYFHPTSREFSDAAGCKGWWMGYFGFRAAPLGPVGPELVMATFYSFAPRLVRRAVPDVWGFAPPPTLLDGRLAAVDAFLRDVLGDQVTGEPLRRAAELAGHAAASAVTAGRPLAAANAALPVPGAPHLALWQALTTLREHRGDGHLALLVSAELAPCEALVLAAAAGHGTPELLRPARGWTDAEWDAAVRSLADRGWVMPDGTVTPAGAAARSDIERDTDRLAAQPYRVLGDEGLAELIGHLYRLSDLVVANGAFMNPNPIGLRWPPPTPG